MSAYLYPNLPSKASYKRALANGEKITAMENTPRGPVKVNGSATVTFEGPHYPKPHTFYGRAKVSNGYVTSIK